MALTRGDRLGPYEIDSAIGAGGMGEVYRARDTRLHRDVAIKILPAIFASDPERLARFTREAQVLASLNHQHIAHVYGVEESAAPGPGQAPLRALIMELVDGPSLDNRIRQGPMPLDEALPIARQIAEALDAAHERGIVHRDLKPANIKLTSDGSVKVLDFGLAKALEPGSVIGNEGSAGLLNSPTITSPAMTHAGVVLGTAAYMSPEQARGRPVDKRADIWAFGVVLYEMLTGKQLFASDTVTDTIAEVLKKDVDASALPPATPAGVRRLLHQCLQRDPKHRLRDIGDAAALLNDEPFDFAHGKPSDAARGRRLDATQPASSPRTWLAWSAAALFFVTTLGIAGIHFGEQPPSPVAPARFQISAPPNTNFDIYLSLSPNGQRLAFTARDDKGMLRLWVRDFDKTEARPLIGTEDAWSPFWSPDSRYLGFAVNQQLKKIDVNGGPPQTLAQVNYTIGTGTWNSDDVIVFGARGGMGMQRVSAHGGEPVPVTQLEESRQEGFHSLPVFLPGGREFIYLRQSGVIDYQGIYVGSLDVAPRDQSLTRVVHSSFAASYAPIDQSHGYLLYVREGTLMAQTFQPSTRALTGEPVRVVEQVGRTGSFGFFTVAGDGSVLAFRPGAVSALTRAVLTWIDRLGKPLSVSGTPDTYVNLALAPGGSKAAVVLGFAGAGAADIWTIDFARDVRTRFTFSPAREDFPVWSQDGRRIAFRSNQTGGFDLYDKPSDGAGDERRLRQSRENERPTDWSSDGRYLLYDTLPQTTFDMWVLPLDGDRTPAQLYQTPFSESDPQLSPDGKWLAYQSNESGRNDIYVRPFVAPGSTPSAAGKWQVSRDGGTTPRWRADGKEMFFRAVDGAMVAVDISFDPTFSAGTPRVLFPLPQAATSWDVTGDGQRFLVAMPSQPQDSEPITVVLNWRSALRPQ